MPADVLARETAMALADFVGDDAGLLIACRRILDRQPTSGPLVWLAAHVLGAPDQRVALWDAVDQLEADQTQAALAFSLPDDAVIATVGWNESLRSLARRRGDLSFVITDTNGDAEYYADSLSDDGHQVTLADAEGTAQAMYEATHLIVALDAMGSTTGLAPLGSFAAAAVAHHLERPVIGVASVGVALADRMYQGLLRRWNEQVSEPRWDRLLEEVPTALVSSVVTTAGELSVADAVARGGCPIVPELF